MDNISAAIDNLKSLQDGLISSVQLRGFGTTVNFLFDFLELYEQSLSNGMPFSLSIYSMLMFIMNTPVRVMTFLCGIPNFGDGSLKEPSKDDDDPLSPQSAFYKNQVFGVIMR